jgi:N-acetylglucosamine-6-phosphate deacetylase
VSTNERTLLTGRLVNAGAVVPEGAVLVDGDRIAFAGKACEVLAQWRDVAPPAGWNGQCTLLPGLVDAHCHGGAGGEFGSDPVSAALAAGHHHRAGTTSLLGSLVWPGCLSDR